MSASNVATRNQSAAGQSVDEVVTELEAAEAEAADLERRYAKALEALERAVADADVAAVMRLRGEAEVVLPQQLGAARIRLLSARVAQAEVAAREAHERIDAAQELVSAARVARDEAQEQAKKTWGEFHAADNQLSWVRTEAGRASSHAEKLRAEHAAYIAGHEQDQQRRLRQLAGLPDLTLSSERKPA